MMGRVFRSAYEHGTHCPHTLLTCTLFLFAEVSNYLHMKGCPFCCFGTSYKLLQDSTVRDGIGKHERAQKQGWEKQHLTIQTSPSVLLWKSNENILQKIHILGPFYKNPCLPAPLSHCSPVSLRPCLPACPRSLSGWRR